MKEFFNIIVVVLVYKNTDDLEEFVQSLTINEIECKIIVVNSFFDEETNDQFKLIAKKLRCDFIQVDNKGYGYGNNRGIEYAKAKYDFDFLILSNPDVDIVAFNQLSLSKYSDGIIGPITKNRTSSNKNPYWYLHIQFLEWLLYVGAKRDFKLLFYISVFFNRIVRNIVQFAIKILRKRRCKVFALQGTFLIFSRDSLLRFNKVFDEDMFLFFEEAHLAHLAKSMNIKMYVDSSIVIYHKQGGSSSSILKKIWQYQRQSIIIYFQKWHKYGKK